MRFNTTDSSARRVRKKFDDVKSLSITSLLDALTIILVFLIKNVSFEAVKVSAEKEINYPSSITNDKIMDKAGVTPIKVFPDKVVVGTEGLDFGAPAGLIDNPDKRTQLNNYLKLESAEIYKIEGNEAVLVVQADSSIPCAYITEIVRIGTDAGFTYIYFATLEVPDWLQQYNVSSTQ